MATQSRRSLGSAKRHAVSSENARVGKVNVVAPSNFAKKRPPLSNLTNQRRGSVGSRPSMVPCAVAKNVKSKTGSSSGINNTSVSANALPASVPGKPNVVVPYQTSFPKSSAGITHKPVPPAPCSTYNSPTQSDGHSVSMDESMSTCDSFKSPDIEYLDENDVGAIDSIERKTSNNLCISERAEKAVTLTEIEMVEKVANVDDNYMDPQYCATFACDIYDHLRATEAKKRPSTDFMEKIQKDINASMRAILIDWLVEVAEEYRLVPDTLYLTVNYIDRYLSGNVMNRQKLQLLGVASMMIAAKYEEICAPQVEEFCYITDNTYLKEEVLEMESAILNYLKFEMTAPTTKCFLRRFVRAAQVPSEVSTLQLECLANYLAELSLLEYHMLQYAPSIIAASAIFLARYILTPSKRPWDLTLKHYTQYEPSDLQECVKALHQLCLNSHSSSLPAIREKYSQHKYKFVAKKFCPPSMPPEYLHDTIIGISLLGCVQQALHPVGTCC